MSVAAEMAATVQYPGRVELGHGAFGEVAAVAGLAIRRACRPGRRRRGGSRRRRWGRCPTTRARRLISLLTRSSGLVDQIFDQWPGEGGEGEHLGLGVVHQRADLGERGGELVADLSQVAATVGGVGLGEDGAEHRGDHVLVGLGDQGEQVAGEVDPAALMRRRLGSTGAARRPGRRAGRR